jgi:site-specific DNA-methyltransferase (adenine-specific)
MFKPMISKLSCEHAGNPDKNGMYRVLSRMELLKPSEICNQSYLTICPSMNFEEANNVSIYLRTKFVRFLILQTLAGMNLSINNFKFVPWLDFTQTWTDDMLYDKYNLTQDEIDFIESIIRPME